MGVGEDEEAGADGFGGHDWDFDGVSKEGDVSTWTLGMPCTQIDW